MTSNGYSIEDFKVRSEQLYPDVHALETKFLPALTVAIPTLHVAPENQYSELAGRVRTYSFDPIGRETLQRLQMVFVSKSFAAKPPAEEVMKKFPLLVTQLQDALDAYNKGADRKEVETVVSELEKFLREIRAAVYD